MDDIKRIDLVDIELTGGSLHRSWCKHSIGKSDIKANAFGVRVFRDGEAVNLSGGSVQGHFLDSQGNKIAITDNSFQHVAGNVAYIILPQACYNYEGQFTLAIKLINSSLGITGTMRIVDGMVDNTNTGGSVAPTGSVPTYEQVLSVFGEMEDALEAADNFLNYSVANTYSGTATYAVGDYVIYNGKLYRCNTAITTAEADFVPGHWTACTAMGQVNGLRTDVAPAYNSSTTYAAGDYVSYNRYFWRSKVDSNTGHTPASGSYWQQVDIANDLKAKLAAETTARMETDSSLLNASIHNESIIVNNSTLSSYNDCNVFPNNVIVLVNIVTSNIAHAPYTDCTYTLISTGWYSHATPYGGQIQIAIPHATDHSIKTRSNNGETWTQWENATSLTPALKSSEIIVTSSNVNSYNNVDNYPINKIVLVNVGIGYDITNYPYANTGGNIITTGWHDALSKYGGVFQIAVPHASSEYNILYRSYDGESWSNWSAGTQGNVYRATPSNFIEVISKANDIRNSIVYLEPGTYSLFDNTHDEAYWKEKRPTTRYCGINLSNGIKLIGQGKVVFDAEYSGSDDDIKENFSVFNIAGSFSLENIEVIGENICYIVHDDQGIVAGNTPSNGSYKNCVFTHEGSDHTFIYGAPICIGGGASADIERTIEKCVFSASQRQNPVNYHTGNTHFGKIAFFGNYFIDGTIGFNKYVGGEIDAIVHDNRLCADIIGKTAEGVTCYEWNNVIAN